MGGQNVTRSQFTSPFSLAARHISHAARSANVLLAWYPMYPSFLASSGVTASQSSEVYVYPGLGFFERSTTLAKLDMIVMRLSVLDFNADETTFLVPLTAGSTSSAIGSSATTK